MKDFQPVYHHRTGPGAASRLTILNYSKTSAFKYKVSMGMVTREAPRRFQMRPNPGRPRSAGLSSKAALDL